MDPMSVEELVAPFSDTRRGTVEALRSLVHRVVPDTLEAVRPGWRLIGYRAPMGRRAPYFGFVWPEPEHVHLGFEYGVFMDDPDRVLQGSGRKLRWVTLVEPDDLPADVLERLVREAVRVASQSHSQRLATLFDRDPV